MKRLGPQAHLVNLRLNHTVPASVRLLPAKEYRGAAIGINYDLRVYTGKLHLLFLNSHVPLKLKENSDNIQGLVCVFRGRQSGQETRMSSR